MKHISSRTNPLVKHVTQLHNAGYRKKNNECFAEGLRTCLTLVQAGWKPKTVFIEISQIDFFAPHFNNHPIITVESHVMEKMSAAQTASGILCVFPIPSQPTKPLTPGLVLHTIADPGNAGTLLRTAAAVGVSTIVVIESVDMWSPKVIQASAGMIAHLSLYFMNWQELLKAKKNIPLCALVVKNGKNDNFLTPDSLIIVGNEAHGIPADHLHDVSAQVTLSMPGNAESLNAGIAGSIALYLAFACSRA